MLSVFFNFFDVIIIALLIYLNIKIWNKNLNKLLTYIILTLILVFLSPIISIIIEFELNSSENNEVFDSFTMLYTFFKFPIYWIIFLIQIILINHSLRKKLFTYQKN